MVEDLQKFSPQFQQKSEVFKCGERQISFNFVENQSFQIGVSHLMIEKDSYFLRFCALYQSCYYVRNTFFYEVNTNEIMP